MMFRPFSFLLYTLTVSTALVSAPFVGDVAAQSTELREGRTVRGTLAQGDTARYTIEVGDDYFVFGEVNQISVDVIVRVLGTDGNLRGSFDGPGRGGERFSGRTTGEGVYTIEVIPFEEETGDYEITLHRVEPVETDPKKLTDQLMSRYDGDDSPGAAVQVWRDNRTLYSRGYGMANLAYGVPFETDTRTNIGSTSKQFTAFAIMLQADRGLLSLDDDIREHITELPEFEETVTVRHLITHTSGLREFLNLLTMTGRRLDHGDWIDRSEVIDIVRRQPALQNAPGAEWNYNNTAFALAAVLVERTSGQDFHIFMRENVFGPLEMIRTMVRPSPEHIVPDVSEGYTPGLYRLETVSLDARGSSAIDKQDETAMPRDVWWLGRFEVNVEYGGGAGRRRRVKARPTDVSPVQGASYGRVPSPRRVKFVKLLAGTNARCSFTDPILKRNIARLFSGSRYAADRS